MFHVFHVTVQHGVAHPPTRKLRVNLFSFISTRLMKLTSIRRGRNRTLANNAIKPLLPVRQGVATGNTFTRLPASTFVHTAANLSKSYET